MALPHEKIRELREKQQRAVAQAREHLDKITDETPEADRRSAETAHDAALAEYDRIGGQIKREEDQSAREAELIEAETRSREQRRPGQPDAEVDGARGGGKTKDELRATAFRSMLRYGMERLDPEHRAALGTQATLSDAESAALRAQGVVDSTAGGYLVPQGFMDELVVSLKAYGPMLDPGVTREIATTTGNLIPWPSMDDTANKGRRLTENTQVNTATLAFGVHQLFAFKYTTDVVLVSSELLQDSAIDPEQIVREAMAIRLGRVVNDDLTLGTGASMPTGIEYAAAAGYTAASATAISFDDMIELEHALDPLYRKMPGVRWMFHDTTLKALRKLKDGDGQYIWQPASVVAKAPATISGFGYEVNQSMPQIATGQRSVVFGDFQRYIVRRVKEFNVRRLNERYADFDQVGFIGFGRYDGALVDGKAMQALAHP